MSNLLLRRWLGEVDVFVTGSNYHHTSTFPNVSLLHRWLGKADQSCLACRLLCSIVVSKRQLNVS
jgi:hypothetical protein